MKKREKEKKKKEAQPTERRHSQAHSTAGLTDGTTLRVRCLNQGNLNTDQTAGTKEWLLTSLQYNNLVLKSLPFRNIYRWYALDLLQDNQREACDVWVAGGRAATGF